MADMRSIGAILTAYGEEHPRDEYPPGSTVEALRPHMEPTYTPALPAKDGWGTPMRYMPLGNRGYVIASAGSDKEFQIDSPDQYTSGLTTQTFDCDIVYSNGAFVQYPEGALFGGGQ